MMEKKLKKLNNLVFPNDTEVISLTNLCKMCVIL